MKISYVQFNPTFGKREQNLHKVDKLIGGVVSDLVVIPELFTSGYFFPSSGEARRMAESIPEGPTTSRLEQWARSLDATLVAGLPEQVGETLYNSAVVVSPSGYEVTYRKLHLYYEEKLHFAPGKARPPVVTLTASDQTTYRLGVMICFDWYYPEVARTLALQGADIIAHPSNLVRKNCPRAMPIRALENHVYTITANRYGRESNGSEKLTFIGQSLICDPQGEVLARADRTGDEVATVEIDPAQARDRQLTAHNDLFSDRVPTGYKL